ncbi:hypothetical protein [Actinomyces urogenitalis]|uniref:hypothetical protein n=1 Tax=Actinomyces urogenitalis TaxID=103621 RepID=UPI0029051443|nr:hypothetical protein [Actinomyces urogenitalis]MDU0864455.1 hypothetical protein [Actinomyces urogenitalis]MDU0875001.1 hypothetical protein [Actinomyces urogenitalis]MDU1565328.1 hypothetical protein [Actinomyces urogenitalis]MDU1640571.1 hypothetical protein [Actinomyces urogenitalis]MDU6777745.1 hypothetical protein [Actinomyces urogenitalis]
MELDVSRINDFAYLEEQAGNFGVMATAAANSGNELAMQRALIRQLQIATHMSGLLMIDLAKYLSDIDGRLAVLTQDLQTLRGIVNQAIFHPFGPAEQRKVKDEIDALERKIDSLRDDVLSEESAEDDASAYRIVRKAALEGFGKKIGEAAGVAVAGGAGVGAVAVATHLGVEL